MTNRRQVLGLGLAASLWPFVGPALERARGDAGGQRLDDAGGPCLYKAICDRRYAAAAAFAAPLRARGVPVQAIDGDVTRVWYQDLALRWRGAPVAIAGLTAPGALFCLEQLAWDHRMRVVFRAERVTGAGGRALRRIEAPAQLLSTPGGEVRPSAAAFAEWAARSAAWAARVPPARTMTSLPAGRDEPGAWVAWAIAPVRRK